MKRRILLCTVTQKAGHGGIARVSALLWDVLQTHYVGSCDLVVALGPRADAITLLSKLNFARRVIYRQLIRRPELLFFDHIGLARVQTLLPSNLRRPYGVFLHAVEAWSPLNGSRSRALFAAKVRVANSRFTADRIAAAHPGIGEIDICHLALRQKSETMGSPAPALSRVRTNSILIVGRVMKDERWKGHDQLISAWPLVRRQVPDAQLVIVGHGDDVARLQLLAQQLCVNDCVLFLGHVDEPTLHAIYNRVAAFAMPSRAEGFGVVYLEAMLHRLPCIGSIHDAAREIIVDGKTGFLVDQDDAAGLAARIALLLTDSALRRQMGANGFERLRDSFSFEQFQARMLHVFQKLSA
jgi:phosphatidyl-myo-inositol dimannoside synthase